MKREQLLLEFEMISHHERMQRLVTLGRESFNAALWDELETGNSYQRRLALQSCQGSRDGERALRFLNDASRLVRGRALAIAADVCDAAQLERALPGLNPKNQRRLLVKLAHKNRQRELDALIAVQAQSTDSESIVALASPQLAAQLLAQQWQRASLTDWARLARAQPTLAIAQVLALAQKLSAPDGALLQRANAVLGAAGEHAPDTALELARELMRIFVPSQLDWSALLRMRAQSVAEIALASDDPLPLRWGDVAHKLERDTLLALAEIQNGALQPLARVLKRLKPENRAALYEKFGRGWRAQDGQIAWDVLELLPHEQRIAEARRHLALPALQAQPILWLRYLAFLGWDEALERLRPFLGDPEPPVRALAHSTLATCLGFQRSHVEEWLEIVRKRGNEQDPVRQEILNGLADLPTPIWRDEHLAALATIQRQALDARDLSGLSASYLQNFVVSLLPRFPEWAGERIAELLAERGSLSFHSLTDRVNEAQMRELGPRLLPIFQGWAQRERAPFLSAMQAFGKRLKVWDAGAQLLRGIVLNSSTAQASSGATILAEHRRDVWRKLVPQLLQKDESWGTQPVVYNYLHLHRQDLLTPTLLGRSKPRGRFWTGKTRFVLPLEAGFWRWTPAQQALYAQTLDEVIADPARDSPGAFFAIDRMVALPDIAPQTLLDLAQLSYPKAAWREAALRVLSRLDGGQGVPTLLDALDDERARIAIYGLRRALLEMPAAPALEIVRNVPLERVTVAKEVVRLLGELRDPAALSFLLEWDARDLHRDVRVAFLRALWDHLEDARVWPILERAAHSDDAAIAIMAARTTAPRVSDAARRRLNALLAELLAHPEARVRLQVLANGAVNALSDPEHQLLQPLYRCLQSPLLSEYRTAARVIWESYASRETELARVATQTLLPRRQALHEVLEQFKRRLIYSRQNLRPTARAITDALATDRLALGERLMLSLQALPADEMAQLVADLTQHDALDFEAMRLLSAELEQSLQYGMRDARPLRMLEALHEIWHDSQNPLLRRLALSALKGAASDNQGWTDERLAQLHALRNDSAPEVASAAQWTFVAGED